MSFWRVQQVHSPNQFRVIYHETQQFSPVIECVQAIYLESGEQFVDFLGVFVKKTCSFICTQVSLDLSRFTGFSLISYYSCGQRGSCGHRVAARARWFFTSYFRVSF